MFKTVQAVISSTFILGSLVLSYSQPAGTLTNYRSGRTGGNTWSEGQYIDFSATSPYPARNYVVEDLPKTPGVKTFGWHFIEPSGCYEIYTSKYVEETPVTAETNDADTRLWIRTNSGLPPVYTPVSDDFGGTLYSKSHIPRVDVRKSRFTDLH